VLAVARVAAAGDGRCGVRVNAVAPGLIHNEFLRRIYPEEFFERDAETRSFLGRVGHPDDVADLAEERILGSTWNRSEAAATGRPSPRTASAIR